MNNQPKNRKILDLDEKIAVIVAFSVIGTILAWVLTKDNQFINSTLFSPSSQTTSSVEPVTTSESEVSQEETPSRRIVPEQKQRKSRAIAPPVLVPTPTVVPEPTPTPSVTIEVIPIPIVVPEPTPAPSVTPEPTSTVIPEPTPTPSVTPEPTPTVIPEPTPTPSVATEPTPAPSVTTEPIVSFQDVTEEYWAYPFIMALAEKQLFKNIIGGDFRPNDSVTRGEYAEILTEALTLTSKQTEIDFKDVNNQSEAKEAIDRAVRGEFLKGYPGDVFEPNQPISKMQVLLSLVSGLELQPSADPQTILSNSYQDWQEIPEYAQRAIAAATESGLVINYPNVKIFNPNAEATRAEIAAMIHQALVVLQQQAPVESQYIVKP